MGIFMRLIFRVRFTKPRECNAPVLHPSSKKDHGMAGLAPRRFNPNAFRYLRAVPM